MSPYFNIVINSLYSSANNYKEIRDKEQIFLDDLHNDKLASGILFLDENYEEICQEKFLFLHNNLTSNKFANMTFSFDNFDHIFEENFHVEPETLEELKEPQKEWLILFDDLKGPFKIKLMIP